MQLLIIHDQHRNAGIIVDIVNDALNLVPVTASNAASDAGRNAHNVIIIEYGVDPQQVERLPQIVVGSQIKRPINRGGELRKQITDFQLLALCVQNLDATHPLSYWELCVVTASLHIGALGFWGQQRPDCRRDAAAHHSERIHLMCYKCSLAI